MARRRVSTIFGKTLLRSLIFIWAFSLCAEAADGAPRIESEFIIDRWGREEGLAESTVTSITQTSDGYLWLSSFNGIARFDGVTFTVFNKENTPALRSDSILHIHGDRSGRLWMLGVGGELTLLQDGQFKALNGADGLPDRGVSMIAEETSGSILLGSRYGDGVFRSSSNRFTLSVPPEPFSIGALFAMVTDNAENIWAGSGKELLRLSPGRPEKIVLPEDADPMEAVMLGASRRGDAWLATRRRIYHAENGQWIHRHTSPEVLGSGSCMLQDSANAVWVGTWNQGIFRFDASGALTKIALSPTKNQEAVRDIYEDAQGNLWLGGDASGLIRFKRRVFKPIGLQEGLTSKIIRSVSTEPDGSVWAFGRGSAQVIDPATESAQGDAVPFPNLWCGLIDSRGDKWVGTYGGFLGRQRGAVFSPNVFGDTNVYYTHALFEDSSRRIWAGGNGFLWRIQGNQRVPISPPGMHLNEGVIRSMAEMRDGRLFFGSSETGLWEWNKQGWRQWTAKEGLVSKTITALCADSKDRLWIGTRNHLHVLTKEGLRSLQTVAPRLPQNISSITEGSTNQLWLGTAQGIFGVDPNELASARSPSEREPRVWKYSRADGLSSSEVMSGIQPVVCKTADGRIWFATLNGVTVLDPRHPMSSSSTQVAIQKVLVDRQQALARSKSSGDLPRLTSANENELLIIPAGSRSLEIHYTSLNLGSPQKSEFRYRLEGVDDRWVEAGDRRVAYYQSIPPGVRRFELAGRNEDGLWDEQITSVRLEVLPLLHQKRWFQAMAALVCLGLLGFSIRALFRHRMALELRVYEQRLAVDKERARIARDIHDEVGARLSQLNMLGSMALSGAATPTQTLRDIKEMGELSREVVRDLDELVWSADPAHDQTGSLIEYLCSYAEGYLKPHKVECRFHIAENIPLHEMGAQRRHQIFVAFKECLHNVVKHASATIVTVAAAATDRSVVLVVSDNGKGMRGPGRAFGNGVRNMQTRLQSIGGSCIVASNGSAGLTVTFTVPSGARVPPSARTMLLSERKRQDVRP